jgi:hypothetical protein
LHELNAGVQAKLSFDALAVRLNRLVVNQLIANTDRHFGNLAFYDNYNGRFELAPVYDMLPMLFAPEHDQTVARIFQPPDPTSDTLPRTGAYADVDTVHPVSNGPGVGHAETG